MLIDEKILEDSIDIDQDTLFNNLDHFEIERCFVLEYLEMLLKWNKQTLFLKRNFKSFG